MIQPVTTGSDKIGSGWILALIGSAFLLSACAASPPPAPVVEPAPAPAVVPPPPPPDPEFIEGRTYIIAEVEPGAEVFGPDSGVGIRTFCDVTILRRYRVRYNRQNWPTCSSRELFIGVARPGEDPDGVKVDLQNGQQIRVWEVFDLAAGPEAAPLAGRYALAAYSREQDTIEIFTGLIPVYEIEPGRIHYLGRLGTTSPVVAYDARAFSSAFLARFPQIRPARLELSAPSGFDTACAPALGSTDQVITGFDCIGQRVRGSLF